MALTTYRCEVDLYRNGFVFRGSGERLYDRNTAGVYLVGARNAKEAKEILQKAIKFGSITVPKRSQWRPDDAPTLKHGQIVKIRSTSEEIDGRTVFTYTYDMNFRNATDPVPREA